MVKPTKNLSFFQIRFLMKLVRRILSFFRVFPKIESINQLKTRFFRASDIQSRKRSTVRSLNPKQDGGGGRGEGAESAYRLDLPSAELKR